MVATEVIQKVELVKGEFTPSEATDIISGLIGEKINFHKIQRLHSWVGDECCDNSAINCRIEELLEEKSKAIEFLKIAKASGMNIEIKGDIEISFKSAQ
jgi:hypothetical protein